MANHPDVTTIGQLRESGWVSRSIKDEIDLAVAGVLSWEARRAALEAGLGQPYEDIYAARLARGEELIPCV